MSSAPTYSERREIAQSAYEFLDAMKTEPSGNNFINLVDIINILVTVINSTDTKKKCQRAYRCPDALRWLWERGYDYITETINACQESLIKVEERVNRTGSWALDAQTFALCEVCFKWYQELCSVMPRTFLLFCIQQCQGVHEKTDKGQKIGHFCLDPDYSIKEQVWASKS